MKIGIDYAGTISLNPAKFRKIAQAFLAAGHQVYIVSVVDRGSIKDRDIQIAKSGVPHTKSFLITCEFASQMPKRKYEICKKLKIDIFIDDRFDICEYLFRKGIMVLNSYVGISRFQGLKKPIELNYDISNEDALK